MRVEYFQNIKFEWDSQKASLNLRNHHLTFETACEAFFDPFIQLSPVEVVAGEEREAIYWHDFKLAASLCRLYHERRRNISSYLSS